MKIARKLLLTGGASLVMAGGVLVLPLARPAGATPVPIEALKEPVANKLLKQEANTSFEVKTEVDAGDHTLKAMVTNKSSKSVVPTVTFNGELPLYTSDVPLKPGETRPYFYYFTGNNMLVDVQVSGEGMETVSSSVMVDIQEPVSFQATETNDTVIIGTLRNNSTLVPQTVYTKVGSGDVHIEYLEPGESRTIAMSHTAVDEQKVAGATIATGAGYESRYSVELGIKPELGLLK